ncbi:tetratricopeptide repeat protein [Marinilabiliaceae bacterium JC017]|nr:tetratricopeptide repeat protein [Marinilabiliaceae bacterium JC017]
MRRVIILLVMIYSSLFTFAEDQRFSDANELYSSGKYEEAIAAYGQILDTGMESPELYFNLGNSYYKNGQLPQAILNFERAQLLAPHDKDIKYNLELSYSQTTDKIEKVGVFFLARWFQGLRDKGDSDFWSIITLISFFLFLIAAALYLFMNSAALKKTGFFAGVLFISMTVITFSYAQKQKQKLLDRSHAIVFSPSVTVKSSPDNSGTELFILHEGTKVEILSTLGDWKEIQLSDGNVGWLKDTTIVVI